MDQNNQNDCSSVTEMGNPAKPQGCAGAEMLERMSESHRPVTDWALSHLEISGNERVLDIGCGGGAALKKMSSKITTGSLTGADYSEVSVEVSCRNNIEDVESGKMKIIHASVDSLPFEDNFFDIIYTIESFYFWSDPAENLKEVRRVLAKNGVFLIVADIYGDAELSLESLESVRKYGLFNPTADEFRQLLLQAGFSNVKIHTNKGTTWICTESRK